MVTSLFSPEAQAILDSAAQGLHASPEDWRDEVIYNHDCSERAEKGQGGPESVADQTLQEAIDVLVGQLKATKQIWDVNAKCFGC